MKVGRQLQWQSTGYFPIWRPIISEFPVVTSTSAAVEISWETKLWLVFGNSTPGLRAYPLVYILYNLTLLSLIPGQNHYLAIDELYSLPLFSLSLPHSQIHIDKGGNSCTRLGVVFASGASMVIALHTRFAGLSCKQQQPLSCWWNVGRFHTVFVSLLLRHHPSLFSVVLSFKNSSQGCFLM